MAASSSSSQPNNENEQNKTEESSPLSSSLDLTHPEILPCSTLRSLFKERGVQDQNIDNMDKAGLVQLFYKTLLPLPQRKYRLNREGANLSQKQETRKRAASNDGETSTRPTKRLPDVTSRLNGTKVISLKKETSEGSRVISLKKETSDSPKPNNVRIKFGESSVEKSDSSAKGSRVIKLINRTLQSEVDKSKPVSVTPPVTSASKESKVEANKSDNSPVKRHARITWP